MAEPTGNMLLRDIEYKIEESASGARRSYMYPDGRLFTEYKSYARFMGMPLVHITRGPCPETGRSIIARGWIAVGRVAVGGVAVGQAGFGLVGIGQLGMGVLFGVGQAATGMVVVGQLAVGLLAGLGQIVCGYWAAGQLAIGVHVVGQMTQVVEIF